MAQPSAPLAVIPRLLACPVCRRPLAGIGSALRCGACDLRYLRAGDVHLLRPPFSPDVAPHPVWGARMRDLLEEAERVGWTQALAAFRHEVLSGRLRAPDSSLWERARAKVNGQTWEDVLHELVDPTRAGWKFLLDQRPQGRILVLGPTLGAAPLVLARRCAQVIVLDGSLDRLRLVAVQAAAAGLGNVTLACVRDPFRLPAPGASVDLAVVPGLAHWLCNTRVDAAGPAAIARFLSELHRVLAPGGQAWVGTMNRSRLWRLFDAGAASVASSPTALQHAALATGFRDCRLVAPIPFRHKFHQVVDLERADRMGLSIDPYRARGRLVRVAVRAWDAGQRSGLVGRRLYRKLPAIGALLSTGPARDTFAERLLEHVAAGARLPVHVRLAHYYVRAKGVVVLVGAGGEDGGLVVRLPLDEPGTDACRRHQAALTALANDTRLPAALRALFPAPLAQGTFEGQEYFAETGLPGESGQRYYTRSRRRYDRAITEAADVLAALRRATERPVRIEEREFHRLCGRWLAELTTLVGDDRLGRSLHAIRARLRRTLVGRTLPLGWQHGDLDFANVLYDRADRITAVLDFEMFEARGLPLLDLLFVLARRPTRRRLSFGTIFTRTILPRALPPLESTLLAREIDALGADEELYRALALCCWLNHLRLRRDSWLVRSPAWLEANLHAVVADVRRVL